MTNTRAQYVLCLSLLALFLRPSSAGAQDLAGLEQGIKPYGAYHGGDIDAISMVNGSLTLNVPIISYPQRGGKLHVGFSIVYNTPSLIAHAGSTDCVKWNVCYPTEIQYWPSTYFNIPHTLDLRVVPDFYPELVESNFLHNNLPDCTVGNGLPYDGDGCNYPEPTFEDYSVLDYDGANHHAGQIGANLWLSRDATGYELNTTVTPANTLVLTDRNGTQFTYIALPAMTETTGSGTIQIGPASWGRILKIEDANGNFITANYSTSGSGASTVYTPTGWTDTLGRTIPWAVGAGFPGPNGGTSPFTVSTASQSFSFALASGPTCTTPTTALCAVPGYTNTVTQSVGLPNGTAYTFAYDPVTGALSQITLPTGGTISYTWATSTSCSGPPGIVNNPTYSLQVTSRIVDAHDGTGPHTWRYAYGSSKTTVTDPLGNDTVHLLTALGTQVCANVYETEKDTYAGSSTSGGTLLEKTVTTYQSAPDPYILANSQEYNYLGGLSGLAMNVVPNSIVQTVMANGVTSKITKSYDAGILLTNYNVNAIYGDVTQENEYDFGTTTGSAGPLLRTTNTKFMALNGPNASQYLANNILSAPYTVEVLNGAGTRAAFTQYNYDEATPASSGLSTSNQLDTAPPTGSLRGNNTSTMHWLNLGSTTCPNGYSGVTGYVTSHSTFYNSGMVAASLDGCGNATSASYSLAYQGALPTTITNALGQATTNTYDLNTGLITISKDPNQQSTTYGYDSSWRLTSIGRPDGGATTYCYTDLSATQCPGAAVAQAVLFSKTQTPNPIVQIETDVDGLGRKNKQRTLSDPQGVAFVDTAYDALGRTASVSNSYRSVSDPTYGSTSFHYDALNRKTSATEPDGSSIQWCYNGSPSMGQTICQPNRSTITPASWTDSTDEVGNPNQKVSDALGRLRAVMEPQPSGTTLSMETDYSYDTLNDLTSVVQHGLSTDTARTRSFQYDSLSRLLWSQNPEAGMVCYGQGDGTIAGCQANGYDANGNLLHKTDARGVATTYGYDAGNEMITKSYSGSNSAAAAIAAVTPPTSFTYGALAGPVANGVGRLVTEFTGPANAPLTTRSIGAYDAMGRVLNQQQNTPNSQTSGGPYALAYTYDLGSNITSVTYPDGRLVQQKFDGAAHMNSVQYASWNGIGVNQSYFSEANGYDAAGHLVSSTFGNGIPFSAVYDSRERVGTISYGPTNGPLWSKQYGWTRDNNLQSATDLVTGIQRQFNYDTLNRLTDAQDIFSNLAVPSGSNGETGSTSTSGSSATETTGETGASPVWTNPDDSNLLTDIGASDSTWGVANAVIAVNAAVAPDGTMTATTVTATSGSTDTFINDAINSPATYDLETMTGSVWLRSFTGTQTVNLYIVMGSSGVILKQVQLTTTWQQFQVSGAVANNLTYLAMQIGGGGSVTSGGGFMLWSPMLEDEGLTGSSVTNIAPYSQRMNGGTWSTSAGSVAINTVVAPDGTPTGATLTANGGPSDNYVLDTVPNPAPFSGVAITGSVWLRVPAGTQTVSMNLWDVGSTNAGPIGVATFTLTTTWQRFQVTGTTQNSLSKLQLQIGGNYSFTNSEVINAWGAQLELASVAGPYIATADVPVTLGTSMTNLLPYSQELSNWNLYTVSVDANTVTAPDGSVTAAQVTATSGDSNITDYAMNPGLYNGETVTASVYLRSSSGTPTIKLYPFSQTASGTQYFTPLTVTLSTTWQRFQVTGVLPNGLTGLAFQIGGAGSFSTGAIIDVWGAQMEIASQAGPYVATTALPITTGQVETNVLPNSQQLNGPSWETLNATVTPNAASAPDGTMTAAAVASSTGSSIPGVVDYVPNPSLYDGQTVTASVYLRVASGTLPLNLTLSNSGNQGWVYASQSAVTLTTAWQRFDLTATLQNGLYSLYLCIQDSGSNSGGFQVWGAQLNVGNAPAPYIPTVSTTTVYSTGQVGTLVPTGLNQAFTYDSFGNLLQNGSFNTTFTSNNQMFGYAYDASGNLLTDRISNVMTWDAESRLSTVAGSTYLYDADGNRVEKQGSSVVDTVYFGGQPIARYAAGKWTDLVYGPNGLLAEVPGMQTGSPIYRVTDNLGNDVGSLLASGNFVDSLDHTPFGQVISGTTSDPYIFTGKERDTESGLDYFGARYYGSNIGRWMSPDSINITEDRMMNPSSTLNKYAYGANNPLKFTDPDGKDITIFYEAANIFQSSPSPGHTMLLAYNQQTGDSAVRSFGPDHSAPGFSVMGTIPGETGTDTFGFENIKSPDDLRANFASVTIQTTPEEAQQVINEIRAHPDGNYTLLSHNCTTTCSRLLRSIGKTRSHALQPAGFFGDLVQQYGPHRGGKVGLDFRPGSMWGQPRPGYNPFQLFFNDIHCTTVTSTIRDSNGNAVSSSSSTKCN